MISDFALFLFTTLAGAAAGAYVARAIVPLKGDGKKPMVFALVCLALLGVSGVALLAHLKHPELVLNAFTNLGAGIAQEGVTTILFGLFVLVDCVLCAVKKESPRWLVIVTAVLGVAMTVTMGLAYAAFVGEPAWATPATIPFFVLGDLAMGAGLYLAFNGTALEDQVFNKYFIAAQALAAIAIVIVCIHFAGVGAGIVGLLCGLVVGPVASSVLVFRGKNSEGKSIAFLVCALAVIGIAIARYAYYAASLF